MSKVIKASEVKKGDWYLGRVTESAYIEVNDDDGLVEDASRGGTRLDSITLILDTGVEVEVSENELVAIQDLLLPNSLLTKG